MFKSIINEQDSIFYQGMTERKTEYQENWDAVIMSDYSWALLLMFQAWSLNIDINIQFTCIYLDHCLPFNLQ